MRRRLAFLLAGSMILTVGSLTSAHAAYPAWSPPLSLAGGGAEPSIRVPADGRSAAYISAPTGLGSNFWAIHEAINSDGSHAFSASAPLQPDIGTGGGDSEISVSPVVNPSTGCATIAYSGLHNIDIFDNFTTASSTDCGNTFTSPNLFATQNTATDRQWQTFDGAKTNLLLYHKVDTSQIVISRSFDGGQTYTSVSPEGARGIEDTTTFLNVAQDNQVGNLTTNYSEPIAGMTYPNGDQVHALYATFVGPRDLMDNLQHTPFGLGDSHEDTVYVARSVDGGVTWSDTKVYSTDPADPSRELNILFPVVAVDAAGTIYSAWSDGFLVQYSYSNDHGATWSNAVQLNPPSAVADSNLMPWIAAAGNGGLDAVWYHGEGGAAGWNKIHRDPGDTNTAWTVAFSQLAGANTASPTVVQQSNDIVGPIHHGDICQNGTLCGVTSAGDRTLLDFFQVAIDANGRANIAYASDEATHGSATVMYTRQNAGVSAIDGSAIQNLNIVPQPTVSGTSCPGPQIVDPYGDAPYTLTVGSGMSGNNDKYDIGSVKFETPNATQIKVTMTIKNLNSLPQPVTLSGMYDVFWQYKGHTYYVQADISAPGVAFYDTGEYTNNFNSSGTPQGQENEGPNGTIVWTVDRSLVGSPKNGDVLGSPYANDRGALMADNTGLYYTATVDRAPDIGSGSDYTLAGAC
ncbi:MAG: sialidase family protein [Actinomycetota bacterium]